MQPLKNIGVKISIIKFYHKKRGAGASPLQFLDAQKAHRAEKSAQICALLSGFCLQFTLSYGIINMSKITVNQWKQGDFTHRGVEKCGCCRRAKLHIARGFGSKRPRVRIPTLRPANPPFLQRRSCKNGGFLLQELPTAPNKLLPESGQNLPTPPPDPDLTQTGVTSRTVEKSSESKCSENALFSKSSPVLFSAPGAATLGVLFVFFVLLITVWQKGSLPSYGMYVESSFDASSLYL